MSFSCCEMGRILVFDASKVHPMELNYHVWHGAIQYRACLMYKRCVWCFMFDTEPFNIELAWCIRDVFGALKLVHTRKTSKKLEHISPWMPQICIGNNPMVLENPCASQNYQKQAQSSYYNHVPIVAIRISFIRRVCTTPPRIVAYASIDILK